ncbi:tetratricopeptide repeat protein [Desulfobotulus mexicanus]|nr:tetratricopeptide repeat protein [Desulfobotulus mexicanus]
MDSSQNASANGSGNVIIQISGDGNHIDYKRPYLTLIPPKRRAPRAEKEIDLLNPYSRSIPLIGRDANLKKLWEWLHTSRPISVCTIAGGAGCGKTRMAIELISHLDTEEPGKWQAGFLTGKELKRFADLQNLADWGWQKPVLIVVDYAAGLTSFLKVWLEELSQNEGSEPGPPLRILLLEREADKNGGWFQSLFEGGFSEARVPELFDPPEPMLLDTIDTPEHRRELLTAMLERLSRLHGQNPPPIPLPGENSLFDQELAKPTWKDPLYLMMAALLSLRSGIVEVLELPRTELAFELADREMGRFSKNSPPGEKDLLLHLAALVTMNGGLSQSLTLELAKQECDTLGKNCTNGPGVLVDRLSMLLPAPDHGIAPVLPDILGEALVLRIFGKYAMDIQKKTMKRMVDSLDMYAVVPFVIRTLQDFSHTGNTRPMEWLEALIETGKTHTPDLLFVLEGALPQHTLSLREKAVEITKLLLEQMEKSNEKKPEIAILAQQAGIKNNLAVRLSELGRREEALQNAEKATEIYRQLAEARPEAFLPNYATSLNNLANHLSELGRREEALHNAEKAMEIYRQLAEARPEAFLPEYARSLNNLANRLSELGRREEALHNAEKAVEIRKQLAEARPEAFLPEYAGSLNNLANHLSELGRREEALYNAEKAVKIDRQLAEARPEAFLPEYAGSLNNLANHLSELGRREEALYNAEKAVEIYKQLAAARPEAFLPDLAMTCGVKGKILLDSGKHQDAASSFAEGIQALLPLFTQNPHPFKPLMATLLQDYLKAAEQIGQKPENTLLDPVMAIMIKTHIPNSKE